MIAKITETSMKMIAEETGFGKAVCSSIGNWPCVF